MKWYIWLILLTIFQIVDGLTTYWLAHSFGIEDELNPIVRYSMNYFGIFYGLLIPKLIVMIPAFLLLKKYWYSKIIRVAFKTVTCIYLYVACYNALFVTSLGVFYNANL